MSLRVRFRLGSLIWMITILAVLLGWWIDRRQLQATHLKERVLLRDQYQELRRHFALERERSKKMEYQLKKALKAGQ